MKYCAGIPALIIVMCATVSAWASPSGGAFAGPTRASGSSIYWNPAALTQHNSKVNAGLEASLLFAEADYARSGIDSNGNVFPSVGFASIAPNLDFNLTFQSPSRYLTFIVGGFSPGAAATRWPRDGPQRYVGTRNHLISYAAVAGFALGGETFGVSVTGGPVYSSLKVSNAMDLASHANSAAGADLLTYENPELQAWLDVSGHAWTGVAQFGFWAQPAHWLRLGGSLRWTQDIRVNGDVSVALPDSIDVVLPNVDIDPDGDIFLDFGMPWVVNAEAELRLRGINLGLMMQYQTESKSRNITGAVTQADPDFIEGPQLSPKGSGDDWMIGARLSREFGERAEIGVRFDYDPRSVPDEVLNVINLDFTQYEMSLATLWRFSENAAITGTYAFIYIPTINVTGSLFNPRADVDSGFSSSPGDGRYSANAHRLTVSFQGTWGQ